MSRSAPLLTVCLATVLAASASAATALDHLRAAAGPRFRKGHSLPPLTRWGWLMPLEVRIELADHWGRHIRRSDCACRFC